MLVAKSYKLSSQFCPRNQIIFIKVYLLMSFHSATLVQVKIQRNVPSSVNSQVRVHHFWKLKSKNERGDIKVNDIVIERQKFLFNVLPFFWPREVAENDSNVIGYFISLWLTLIVIIYVPRPAPSAIPKILMTPYYWGLVNSTCSAYLFIPGCIITKRILGWIHLQYTRIVVAFVHWNFLLF